MEEKQNSLERGEYIIGIAIVLSALLVSASIYMGGSAIKEKLEGVSLAGIPNNGDTVPLDTKTSGEEQPVVVLSDKRCTACKEQADGVLSQLEIVVPNLKVETYDLSDEKGKAIFDNSGIEFLPAFLFSDSIKNSDGYPDLEQYLEKKGEYLSLKIGSSFDPNAEICGNGEDDDLDGKADCEDTDCENAVACLKKVDKPVVELFVMSHCPYGTQMEKGMIPAIDALGDAVDWNIRFVYYAMHGETEVNEELLQHCMQKQDKTQYFNYLACFLKEGKSDACLAEVGAKKDDFQKCIDKTDTEFEASKNLNDQSLWLSGYYPLFNVDKALNEKYGVGGSPHFVLNGVSIEGQARSPAAILKTVCAGFETQPEGCSTTLEEASYSAGFGFTFTAAEGGGLATCGG